jgi:copper chaperone CopZ
VPLQAQRWRVLAKKGMSTYFFKTNINCLGCASQVKPHMDKLEQKNEIEHWNVHLNTPEHLLEVVTNKMSPEQVKHYIREAGFEAEFTKAPQA